MKLSTCLTAAGLLAFSAAAFAERPHLVKPDQLQKYWLVSGTGDPMAPSSGKNLSVPSCAAVSYLIERNGTTSHIKLEKIVPDGDLRSVALSIISNVRYTAAQTNIGKDPVYTYVILPFNAPDVSKGPSATAERQRIIDQCAVDDFKLPDGF
ncbi:MAG: energy transducer TonB [Rudaea sp.]